MPQNPKKFINTPEDLDAYQIAFAVAMKIFELSQKFPRMISPP